MSISHSNSVRPSFSFTLFFPYLFLPSFPLSSPTLSHTPLFPSHISPPLTPLFPLLFPYLLRPPSHFTPISYNFIYSLIPSTFFILPLSLSFYPISPILFYTLLFTYLLRPPFFPLILPLFPIPLSPLSFPYLLRPHTSPPILPPSRPHARHPITRSPKTTCLLEHGAITRQRSVPPGMSARPSDTPAVTGEALLAIFGTESFNFRSPDDARPPDRSSVGGRCTSIFGSSPRWPWDAAVSCWIPECILVHFHWICILAFRCACFSSFDKSLFLYICPLNLCLSVCLDTSLSIKLPICIYLHICLSTRLYNYLLRKKYFVPSFLLLLHASRLPHRSIPCLLYCSSFF